MNISVYVVHVDMLYWIKFIEIIFNSSETCFFGFS